MEAVSKGASENNGMVIGILPGTRKDEANQYVNIAIPTGMGIARNVLVVNSSDVIIALGAFGTLSEIALALATEKLITYGAWDLKRIGAIDSSGLRDF